jgi:prevent-host-death family protein
MESIAISQFKTTCFSTIERVRQTGQPVLVTRRGVPVALVLPPPPEPPLHSRFGCMRGTAEQLGDIVSPLPKADWGCLA